MKFRYSARNKKGELQFGFVEALNQTAALKMLGGHGLFILKLDPEKRGGFFSGLFGFLNRITKKDLAVFNRQLAVLLESGTVLGDALKIVYVQTENRILRRIIFEISSDLEAGFSFSKALERHSEIFSEFYINFLRSAETNGSLIEAFSFLGEYCGRDAVWWKKIRNFMAIFIFIAALLIIGGIFFFTSSASGLFLLIFSITFWLLIDYFRSREGRMVFANLILSVPIIGDLFKKMEASRFSEAASALLKSGVPFPRAVEISSSVADSMIYRDLFREASDALKHGKKSFLQIFFKNHVYFPALSSEMLAVAETAGKIEEAFGKIADFYSRELEEKISNLEELTHSVLMAAIVLAAILFFILILPSL